MLKKIKKYCNEFENGSGGISYAMYLIAILISIILFMFFQFNTSLYVAEQTIENGLHIAENKVMTSNTADRNIESATNIFEKEAMRLHIVTSFDSSSNSLSPAESAELRTLADEFTETLQAQLGIEGTTPAKGILLSICTRGSKVQIDGPVYIYEPIYERTVTATRDGNISGTSIPKFKFESLYAIKGWIEYTLNYNDTNSCSSVGKRIIVGSTPKLKNGHDVEGATIEATVALSFTGVRNIFASSGSSTLFSRTPTENVYSVKSTQSTDIVIATQDSRQQ